MSPKPQNKFQGFLHFLKSRYLLFFLILLISPTLPSILKAVETIIVNSKMDSFINITNVGIALVALAFTFLQNKKTEESSEEDRNLQQDQEIKDIAIGLANLTTRFDCHVGEISHQGGIVEILRIKEEVGELKTMLAILTKQGEIELKITNQQEQLSNVLSSINKLNTRIDSVIQQISMPPSSDKRLSSI